MQEQRGEHAHSGWRKDDPASVRRKNLYTYEVYHHHTKPASLLASARWAQALANVHQDPETKAKLTADAKYFYREYHKVMRG